SMSREAEPLKRIAANYAERLSGFGANIDLLTDPKFGTTVRARFSSGSPDHDSGSDATAKQLLVVGHLDTVWPIGTLSARPFRVEDGRAYGPGIFDMKAGVTISSFAMKALKDLKRGARRQVTFLMTCDEETGSHFSREIIEDEARTAAAAFVLEP